MRLLLIARRFWPLSGGRSRIMQRLAEGFVAAGHEVTVVTPQWDPTWPTEIRVDRLRVVRLPHSELPIWGVLRSMSTLSAWLTEHRARFDAACVSGLAHDAFTAVGTLLEASVPVVLRAESAGPAGDCRWQDEITFGWGIRSRCQTASAFVAPSPVVAEELRGAGYASEKIHVIQNAMPILPRPDAEERAAIWTGLGEIDGCHAPPAGAACVIALSRFEHHHGLVDLLKGWREVLAEHPESRLWLLGEGEDRDVLAALANGLGIHPRVCLPGTLDDTRDALRAADVVVRPAHDAGTTLGIVEAMAAGSPIVATDLPAHRLLIDHEIHGLLVPREEPAALARAISRLIADRPLAGSLGLAAQGRAAHELNAEAAIAAHLELFQQLIASPERQRREA